MLFPLYSNSALINWPRPRLLFNPAGLLLLLLELIQNGLTVKLQGIVGNISFCEMYVIIMDLKLGFILVKTEVCNLWLDVWLRR